MKEYGIRPKDLKTGQEEAFKEDIDRLLEHVDEFEAVVCPACGISKRVDLYTSGTKYFLKDNNAFVKYKFMFIECHRCGTIYILKRPSRKILDQYYANSEHYKYWSKYIFPKTEKIRREQIFRPRAEMVSGLVSDWSTLYKKKYNLLDVGAGYGTFCEEVKKLGIIDEIYAVEPSILHKECSKRGIKTYHQPIEKLDIKGIDCITAFELIEHLFSPKDFLNKCHDILNDHGLLILTTPNCHGFDIALLGEKSDQINPEHLQLFNIESLSLLLKNCKFKVLEVMTPGKLDVDIVKNKIKDGEYTPDPFLQSLLNTGDKFQKFLADNNLSSHLWIVAQKDIGESK